MNKIALLSLFFTLAIRALPDELFTLLSLKPGSTTNLAPEAITKDYAYTITKDGKVIKSVEIEFNQAAKSATYLKPETKGYCLIDPPKGHIPLNRYFFFEMTTKRRYELTPLKDIKSILIQDMPGAVEHTPCTFGSFKTQEKKKA
jgi:hypothetical protein